MPRYDYECLACRSLFEITRSIFKHNDEVVCPRCGSSNAVMQYSPPNLLFHRSKWRKDSASTLSERDAPLVDERPRQTDIDAENVTEDAAAVDILSTRTSVKEGAITLDRCIGVSMENITVENAPIGLMIDSSTVKSREITLRGTEDGVVAQNSHIDIEGLDIT